MMSIASLLVLQYKNSRRFFELGAVLFFSFYILGVAVYIMFFIIFFSPLRLSKKTEP